MKYVALLTETWQLDLKSTVLRHLENDPFLMVRRKGNFSMLKLELKPTVWHQKDLCVSNIALDIETFSSLQPSWTLYLK